MSATSIRPTTTIPIILAGLMLACIAAPASGSLARTSHQVSAATADAPHPAALSHLGVLNVLSSTPPRPSDRKLHCARYLDALATKPGEKCGLADSAGIWETQRLEATMVAPDGAKASVDLGPARTGALGHLDSDGVVDLVVAYGSDDGAFAVVTLGDIRFRMGAFHDRELELDGLPPERPFATEGVVYPLTFAPDWAAVGDYDSDGDFDVVFAAKGRPQLFWMAGDGQGHLDEGRMIDLEGGVTAFTSGDVNRRDGLDDLVVAVSGKAGSALLVFESPRGALSWAPERLAMPNAVTSLAVDWMDGDVWKDIAAAAGKAVILVSGRDRKLVSTRAKRDAVPPAAMMPFEFETKVLDLATGFFTNRDRDAQLAVRLADGKIHLIRNVEREFEISEFGVLPSEGRMTSARASGLPGHDLLIRRPSTGRVEIFHAQASKTSGPSLEKLPAPETLVSEMITGRLNVDSRDDLVMLGSDGRVEVAASKNRAALVVTTTDDTDDGTCNASHCSLREAINHANGLTSGSTITMHTDLGLGAMIEPLGELPTLTQTSATVIDGTVRSGFLTGRFIIQGPGGSSRSGMRITGGNATITRLSIRGFTYFWDLSSGLLLETGGNNTVEGCWFGVGDTGGDSVGNYSGLRILNSNNNWIGGTAAGAGNVISGNDSNGVYIVGTSGNNSILGNLIGTNVSGDVAVPNDVCGIVSNQAEGGGTIGSPVSGGGNVISGNDGWGVWLKGSNIPYPGSWLIQGNTIGLDADCEDAIPNGESGIWLVDEKNCTIGGTNAALSNVISGNVEAGILLSSASTFAQILGNFIGTNGSGLIGIGNQYGIQDSSPEELTIGGAVAGAGNLISGNDQGIDLNGSGSSIEILGNRIGLASDGAPLGHYKYGIYLAGLQNVTIGSAAAPNVIAFNGGSFDFPDWGGIVVDTGSSGVQIGPNSIFDNGGFGIALGNDGVTVNDAYDADTGPNGLQNYPVINSVDAGSGTVDFQLVSAASTAFTILFFESPSCDSSGYGEGKTYLGSKSVTTNSSGIAIDQVVFAGLTPGAAITATATDPDGNTSEFSQCFTVPYGADDIFSDGFESGNFNQWSNVVGS